MRRSPYGVVTVGVSRSLMVCQSEKPSSRTPQVAPSASGPPQVSKSAGFGRRLAVSHLWMSTDVARNSILRTVLPVVPVGVPALVRRRSVS
ncbi:hypothetical protein [Streptomyces sp. NPDC058086]|uniref:hypothetical protein n=1 Tax=Streptomyces sp. NPDC058086 TaxID=3346334 RepID=UPI0036E221F6